MDYEKIRALFLLWSGEQEDEKHEKRRELQESLCRSAMRAIERRTREVTPQKIADYAGELENLAAAKAFLDLVILDEAASAESFSDGGVEVKWGDKITKAQRFYWEKEKEAAAVLLKTDFYFGVMADEG